MYAHSEAPLADFNFFVCVWSDCNQIVIMPFLHTFKPPTHEEQTLNLSVTSSSTIMYAVFFFLP